VARCSGAGMSRVVQRSDAGSRRGGAMLRPQKDDGGGAVLAGWNNFGS
jgi:hypothetical protein